MSIILMGYTSIELARIGNCLGKSGAELAELVSKGKVGKTAEDYRNFLLSLSLDWSALLETPRDLLSLILSIYPETIDVLFSRYTNNWDYYWDHLKSLGLKQDVLDRVLLLLEEERKRKLLPLRKELGLLYQKSSSEDEEELGLTVFSL